MATEHRPGPGQRKNLRVHQVDVDGRHPWVLEDDAGIVELADSEETLEADHPELEAEAERPAHPDANDADGR